MSRRLARSISWIIIFSAFIFIFSVVSARITLSIFTYDNNPIMAIMLVDDESDDSGNERVICEFSIFPIVNLDSLSTPSPKTFLFCNNFISNNLEGLKTHAYQSLLCIYLC